MIILILITLLIVILLSTMRIVPQANALVIERLGSYLCTWNAGIHFKIPIIDRVAKRVILKERVVDFDPQPVITKDNVTMQIDTVVFFQIVDPKLYTYGVDNPIMAIENLTATTLRNIIGDLEFDDTLTSRELINTQMRASLDAATDPWGIKVNRVELKNITPPADIQEVMQKQMTAEREKRQAILEAEAHRQSIVTRAEGEKTAKVLAAEAERDAQIALAEGQAKSIKMVYDAEAEGLRKLSEVDVKDSVLRLKSLEALQKVADGNATKIFMPTDIMDTVSHYGIMSEAFGGLGSTQINEKKKPVKAKTEDACLKKNSSKISHAGADKMYSIQQDLSNN